MKKITLAFVLVFQFVQSKSQIIQSNERFLILTDNMSITKVEATYRNAELQFYNVFLDSTHREFVVFGIMPDKISKKIKWREIEPDSVASQLLSLRYIKKLMNQAQKKMHNEAYPNVAFLKPSHLKPILKKANRYYTPVESVMEYFTDDSPREIWSEQLVLSYIFPNMQQFYQINTHAKVLSISDFETEYFRHTQYPSFNYQGAKRHENIAEKFQVPLLLRAQDTIFNHQKAYKFWLLGIYSMYGSASYRGVERFTYIPKVGIIAGCYDAYWFNSLLRKTKSEVEYLNEIEHDYLHNIQSTPLRIEVNGKLVYEGKE